MKTNGLSNDRELLLESEVGRLESTFEFWETKWMGFEMASMPGYFMVRLKTRAGDRTISKEINGSRKGLRLYKPAGLMSDSN